MQMVRPVNGYVFPGVFNIHFESLVEPMQHRIKPS